MQAYVYRRGKFLALLPADVAPNDAEARAWLNGGTFGPLVDTLSGRWVANFRSPGAAGRYAMNFQQTPIADALAAVRAVEFCGADCTVTHFEAAPVTS